MNKIVFVVSVYKIIPSNWKDDTELLNIKVFDNKEKAESYKAKQEEKSLIHCSIKEGEYIN